MAKVYKKYKFEWKEIKKKEINKINITRVQPREFQTKVLYKSIEPVFHANEEYLVL